MRCFIAVDLPRELKGKIANIQEEIKNMETKLVEKENLHFTLKFLGNVTEKNIELIKKDIKKIKMSPILVPLYGVDVFPNKNFIRVVWIGTNSKEFINLHNEVNNVLQNMFKKEAPIPHLTIARVRTQKYRTQLINFLEKYKNIDFGSFELTQIKLKSSKITKTGPIYNDIEVYDL